MCMQWRIPSRTGKVSWTQHLKHVQRFLLLHYFALIPSWFNNCINRQFFRYHCIVSYRIIISSSSLNLLRLRHLQNIFSWISVQLQQHDSWTPDCAPRPSKFQYSDALNRNFKKLPAAVVAWGYQLPDQDQKESLKKYHLKIPDVTMWQ